MDLSAIESRILDSTLLKERMNLKEVNDAEEGEDVGDGEEALGDEHRLRARPVEARREARTHVRALQMGRLKCLSEVSFRQLT